MLSREGEGSIDKRSDQQIDKLDTQHLYTQKTKTPTKLPPPPEPPPVAARTRTKRPLGTTPVANRTRRTKAKANYTVQDMANLYQSI